VPTTEELIEHLLPLRRVRTIERLLSSDPSSVERVHLVPLDGRVDQVVVKRFVASSDFAAEAGALSVLPAGLPVPTLIAEDIPEKTVIMSDVGEAPSVADALLGTDPIAAEEALGLWCDALAVVHRSTADLRGNFAAALTARDPEGPATIDPMLGWLAGVPHALRACGAHLDVPSEVDDELSALGAQLSDRRWEALSPGDTCPDNNVITGTRLVLIDFAEAAFRHVAWDVAYLRVPWPSCWCAWGIPESVGSDALDRYFTAMNGTVIGADRAAFDGFVDRATLAWALISTSWFLPRGLVWNDSMGPPGFNSPPRRATVLNRIRLAAEIAETQGYRSLSRAAHSWHQAFERAWGPQVLPFAPALR
jgi:hypothetical protein